MIVVSDTGPIHYLLLIQRENLLEQLFQEVAVPLAVIEELTDDGAPELVKRWAESLPKWVKVADPKQRVEPTLDGRGKGERAAIALAKELNAPLLCDDKQASAIARREGLLVSGTLGILKEAHVLGLDDITQAMKQLMQTNYRVTKELVERTVASAHEMRTKHLQEQNPDSDS